MEGMLNECLGVPSGLPRLRETDVDAKGNMTL